MKSALTTTLVLGLTAACLHAQAVPGLISYQGRIVDGTGTGLGTGTPVNRKILFRLFDAGTAGTRLWSEEQTVTISNGDFSVILGQGVSASYNGSPENNTYTLLTAFGETGRYLEMIVDNGDGTLNTTDTPITPRQRLISTAFAIRAATADSVASGSDLSFGGANYGLGLYDSSRPFNGVNVNGPVLYGASGGALGSVNGATKNLALTWNSSGNVGIGGIAASSTHKLDVSGSIHGSSDLIIDGKIGVATTSTPLAKIGIRSDNSLPAMAFEWGNNGFRHFLQTRHAAATTLGNSIDFYLNNSTTAGGSTAPGTGNIHGMTIDAAGVGIGITAPTEKLDVSGNLKLSGNLMLAGQLQGGIRLPYSAAVTDLNVGGGAADNYISFGHQGTSEDFIGYRTNTFYFSDSPGGGDSTQPSINVGNNITAGGNVNAVRGVFGGGLAAAAPALDGGGLGMRLTLYPGTTTAAPFGFGIDASTLFSVVPDSASHRWYGGTTERMSLNGNNGNLAVSGNITAGSKSVPVAEESLRIVRGSVFNDGSLAEGSGFTCTRIAAGHYRITLSTAFSDRASVTATPWSDSTTYDYIRVANLLNGQFEVGIHSSGGGLVDRSFHFIAVGPR